MQDTVSLLPAMVEVQVSQLPLLSFDENDTMAVNQNFARSPFNILCLLATSATVLTVNTLVLLWLKVKVRPTLLSMVSRACILCPLLD